MSVELLKQRPVLAESDVSHLFLVFTDTDLRDDETFQRWSAHLDALIDEAPLWGGRFQADSDQRPGQFPRWRFMAVFGISVEQERARAALRKLEDAIESDGAEFAVWAYDAISDFVKQSDHLLGSRGKKTLSPGAYLTSTRKEA